MIPPEPRPGRGQPRLLEQVRRACRARQFSRRTEEAYTGWIRRYVLFHGKSHPGELNGEAVAAFLTDLADKHNVSTATQNQAASSLLFLYRDVLRIEISLPHGVLRPKKQRRLPIVLTRDEVSAALRELRPTHRLVASLLYGSGLRLLEALQLRVKDVDLERREITVRGGKGGHDRLTMLPSALCNDLRRQLTHVRKQHENDVQRGGGWVALPSALSTKYRTPARTWPGSMYSLPRAHTPTPRPLGACATTCTRLLCNAL